jgi:hypothetical protein
MTRRLHHLLALAIAILSAACASDPIASPAVDAGLADSGRTDSGKADAAQAPEALKLEGVLIDDFEDGDGQTTYPGVAGTPTTTSPTAAVQPLPTLAGSTAASP